MALKTTEFTSVGMGECMLLGVEDRVRTVLGSCVGLLLYSRVEKKSAFGHIVLAADKSGWGPPGKFVDTAIPEMLNMLAGAGVDNSTLIAKVVGGAHMFSPHGAMQIGKSNYEAVKALMRENRIRIAAQEIGGNVGRKIRVDGATGKIVVDRIGRPTVEI